LVLLTKVASAKKGTKSLKTTIPEGIAEYLEISDKDELQWKMDMQDNQRVAVVNKKSKEKDSIELARYSIKQKRNKLSGVY
jgi:bifunctional DNA-binding transcriptional regulator/antitoxin component of YhaV-PrlF toxin-antitoxin module